MTGFLATVAYAQSQGGLSTLNLRQLVNQLIGLINQLIILVAGLAVIVFIWSLIRYLATADDVEARKQWKAYMIYGVIAFAVITGLWGLTNAVLDLVGLTGTGIPQFPGGYGDIDQSPRPGEGGYNPPPPPGNA